MLSDAGQWRWRSASLNAKRDTPTWLVWFKELANVSPPFDVSTILIIVCFIHCGPFVMVSGDVVGQEEAS